MKQVFLKLLKIFLIIVLVLLVLLVVFGAVLSLDWPWWVGLFVLIGLLGLGVGVLFLKKLLLRRREQQFVQQIIAQDNANLQRMDSKEKERFRDLQGRWKEAIDSLRSSHLRKYGNPLYVLPWYVVIGESASGKTTAIKSARLSSPFAEMTRTSGLSGTKNCDWWFFEQAVIIDTAGRYAIPIDEGTDKEEWQKFLTLLGKYRKKEPLNGLVVTVAADGLLRSPAETLEQDGRSIRQRIDELMRVLGARFPVYVLVTKCDLVQGMTQFCNRLPETSLNQAMGLVNHDLSKDAHGVLRRTIGVIADRLRDFRLLLFHKPQRGGIDPALLLFPEEFEKLESGLRAFFGGAFQENPYQETPLLRGVFFSSGRQEGSPYSHFLNALGLIQERDVLPGTSKGLFLHDFFARILPKDRGLFAPTQRAIEWGRLTRNLGLTSWVALVLAVCGLLSFSFVKNLRTLREVSREFGKPPVLQGDVLSDVVIMDHFREAITKVEEQNRNWWVPRFGLNASKDIEGGLKERFCRQFKEGFLVPFDKAMAQRMADFSKASADQVLGQHVAHLVRRINLLRSRLEGDGFEALAAKPQPTYAAVDMTANQSLVPEIKTKFSRLYLDYLVWQPEEAGLNREMNDLQTWLKHVLTLEGTNLNWLVGWVNGEEGMSPVTLEDFWAGSVQVSQEASIMPGFTVKGKERIDAFFAEIEAALVDPLVIASRKLEFQAWYGKAYLDAWYAFTAEFPKGVGRLGSREERQQVAARVGTDQGPYFALLDRMTTELEAMADRQELPAWVSLVYKLQSARTKAAQEATLKESGALGKATTKGMTLITKLEKKLSGTGAGHALESELVAIKGFGEYAAALAEIRPAAASRALAYQMVSQAYQDDAPTSKSPLFQAQNGINKLKTYLAGAESGQKVFWRLVTGPFDYLWHFMRMETSCHLQDLWEKEVLVELQGLADEKAMNRLLLGDEGYAKKFIEGPAAPFVSRGLKTGYYAKKVLGENIPFESSFLSFLTKGAISAKPVEGNYSVAVRGLPTDTNSEATIKAHATRLEVQCADASNTLVNLNYPVSKTFAWSPQSCGDVVFQIEVGTVVLTKKYTGFYAFPQFLKDFGGGQRTFTPADFPNQEEALKRLGIKFIKANYNFKGHEPVVNLLGTAPGRAPRNIVSCWDR